MNLFILSAFLRETGETVRALGPRRRLRGLPYRAFRVDHPTHVLTFAETGMGAANASGVLARMLDVERPDGVISLGYCGALRPGVLVGDLVWASRVCLANGRETETLDLGHASGLGEALSSRLPLQSGTFFTLDRWMRKQDLVRLLPPAAPLPVCDMETYGLARLSAARQVPFFAIRAVSDAAGDEIPFDPWCICDSRGVYRPLKAVRLFLSRPGLLAHAWNSAVTRRPHREILRERWSPCFSCCNAKSPSSPHFVGASKRPRVPACGWRL